ncbi:helix-turn-helix transcriptional regulator [Liquorilactobacillus satsumensis]|uniref:helix-turn-helix domain-containing protein n=1 Tax=Liquorilactobacillus satsumensis TaxID=259059 RepID=UPI0021C3FE45|nr:helix-turn-helix transcriptional regulator [Liquorilactobacillus satsumensis]MCP9357983.1 helix-turn-helix transcriptional regulator [Liquorilactobacillus satsumensis]MCP9371800.1 helix-turn-helix transcriptional regulator [Liquorilactobacillus satsumensis]
MTVDLNRLKAERIAKGYTQKDIAKLLGKENRSWYAKRENGIVSLGANELLEIATVLGYDKNHMAIFFKDNVPVRARKPVTE